MTSTQHATSSVRDQSSTTREGESRHSGQSATSERSASGVREASTAEADLNDAMIVEVLPGEHGWNAKTRSRSRSIVVPAGRNRNHPTPHGRVCRFAKQAAATDENQSEVLARLGQIAGAIASTSARTTVGVGLTCTGHGNRQAKTAIGIATLWAKWGHRTLLVNADSSSREFTGALARTAPSLGDIARAIVDGDRLPIPPQLTESLDGLDVLAGLENWSLAQLGETGILQKIDSAIRTRYYRIVWVLPPLDRHEWSPSIISSAVDTLVLSAVRGKANLRMIESLAESIAGSDWPPLQITWHE